MKLHILAKGGRGRGRGRGRGIPLLKNIGYVSQLLVFQNGMFDDVIIASNGLVKFWNGARVYKPVKVYNGSVRIQKPIKRRNGISWL